MKNHSSYTWENNNICYFKGDIYKATFEKKTRCRGSCQTFAQDALIKPFYSVLAYRLKCIFEKIQIKKVLPTQVILFNKTILLDLSSLSFNCHADNAPLRKVIELGKKEPLRPKQRRLPHAGRHTMLFWRARALDSNESW